MAAKLVMGTDGLALMVLKSQGWHGLAHVQDQISVADCHKYLQTCEKVRLESLTYPDGKVSEFSRGIRLKIDNQDLEIGVVGPETGILQNSDFIDLASAWVDNNLGEIEGAGLLDGGAIIYLQIRAADLKECIIRDLPGGIPDTIEPYVTFVNGHGGMGMLGGWTSIRTVCWNTLMSALRSFRADTSAKKTHRAKDPTNKGENVCLLKMTDIHKMMIGVRKDWKEKVEAYRYLDSVQLKNGRTGLYEYSALCAGKNTDLVSNSDFDPSKKDMDLVRLFEEGKGTLQKSWWDVFNARTNQISHGRSNEMEGETNGDRKARRFTELLIGTRVNDLKKAFDSAMEMAKMQA